MVVYSYVNKSTEKKIAKIIKYLNIHIIQLKLI